MTTNVKMRKLRETEVRERVRGVNYERADNVNDRGEMRDFRWVRKT